MKELEGNYHHVIHLTTVFYHSTIKILNFNAIILSPSSLDPPFQSVLLFISCNHAYTLVTFLIPLILKNKDNYNINIHLYGTSDIEDFCCVLSATACAGVIVVHSMDKEKQYPSIETQ